MEFLKWIFTIAYIGFVIWLIYKGISVVLNFGKSIIKKLIVRFKSNKTNVQSETTAIRKMGVKKQQTPTYNKPSKPKYKNKAKYKTMEDYGEIANVGGISFTAKLQVREKTKTEQHIRQLHLKATEIKKDDINGSIHCLQEAQSLLDEVDTQYPIASYLRLPLFLQQAGRIDEAMDEFETLLKVKKHLLDKSTINDKIKLSLQRNKRSADAIPYGMKAIALELVGRQKYDVEIEGQLDIEKWENDIYKMLKKAKLLDLESKLIELLKVFIDNELSVKNANKLYNQTKQLLKPKFDK